MVLVIISGKIYGDRRGECSFNGTINGKKAATVSCEIALAGSSPYLLISSESAGTRWLIDLTGITKKAGPVDISISVMEYRGNKMVRRFSAKEKVTVKKIDAKSGIRFFDGSFTLAENGKSLIMEGRFSWNVTGFPTDPVHGNLSLQFGKIDLKPVGTTVTPWNSGFQVTKIFLVKPGETLKFTLNLPSINPGTYRGSGASLNLLHYYMENEQLKGGIVKGRRTKIIITKKYDKYTIRFNAEVVENGNTIPVTGQFIEK